jgi:hypothetical protein
MLINSSASPILELANYNILGRILYYVPYHSPIHPGRVITTFAFISFIVEALNGTGVSYSVNQSLSPSQQEIGRSLLKAALVIQLGVLFLFLLLAGTFHARCRRAGLCGGKNPDNPNGKKLASALYTLYASTTLLGVRTIFRVVEYFAIAQHNFWEPGLDPNSLSVVIRYEWYFYVFEASLMLVNHVMINLRHPRRYLPKSAKTYLSALDGKTEVTGPGYEDGRPFWQTLVDPFNLAGLVTGGKSERQKRFWEEEGGRGGDHDAAVKGSQNLKMGDDTV